jgi:hypothetical protein
VAVRGKPLADDPPTPASASASDNSAKSNTAIGGAAPKDDGVDRSRLPRTPVASRRD